MAFNKANLQPIGGQGKRGKAPQMWSYSTLDSHATVDSAGYFNEVLNLLEVGDVILVTVWATAIGSGGTLSTSGFHVVKDKSTTAIDVTDVTALTVTDTD
jgi:hypothetical protein